MKGVLDTESPVSKEVKRFLASSLSWEAALDLSASCQQVCSYCCISLVSAAMLNSRPALHLLCSVRLAMQVSATDAQTDDRYTCRNYCHIS